MNKKFIEKRHIFSLYSQDLSYDESASSGSYTIKDEILVHRINNILRLREKDRLSIFNGMISLNAIITRIEKKIIILEVQEKKLTSDFQKKIRIYLPLLKKEALEEAVYNTTEMGVSEIQLIKTDYSQKIITNHEFLRLEKIIIAACEQSKRFNIPVLKELISLQEAITTKDEELNIWFDPKGTSLFSLCTMLENNKPKKIGIFIGPEADFSDEEKEKLEQISQKYTLTPTILRSRSAVTLGIGIVRSIL